VDTLIDKDYLDELLYRMLKNYNDDELNFLWDAYTSDMAINKYIREDIIICFSHGQMPYDRIIEDFDFIIEEIRIGNSARLNSNLLEDFFCMYQGSIDETIIQLALTVGHEGIIVAALQHPSVNIDLLLDLGSSNDITSAPYDVVPYALKVRKEAVNAHIDMTLNQQGTDATGLPKSWKYTAAGHGWLDNILD
jgi:hypothetical protein